MGILATDILIKSAIEAAFADLRKNSWILDEVFGDLANDSLSKHETGYKEVVAAKQWFLEQNIDVYLANRYDTPRFPCITVVKTSSSEMENRAALSDTLFESEVDAKDITKRVQKVYDNFTPKAYDRSTGTVTLPDSLNTAIMAPNQYLVSKKTGKAYQITSLIDESSFTIDPNVKDDFTEAYIVPPTVVWNLTQEVTFLAESFAIGLHTQSDLNQALWLRQLMQYIFLRYKEAYLERRGFELSTFNVGAIEQNPHFSGVELIWSCPLMISAQVEATFVKYAAPKLSKVTGGIKIAKGQKTPEEYAAHQNIQPVPINQTPAEEVPTANTDPQQQITEITVEIKTDENQ
jgi:hypothetical protein